ncbi:hypothetical protein EV207_16412 [Scopulibacillus darangshiensis]|uniref:Uncharacterized protein n=1 Tax=Scopulibacillus darangshiensis TaxID=442528 RepID=A0A4R2NDY5_9BACL|nr:hypothetical protein [Scopulibacillus darangshiensis]TCP19314.1 hypothetical protein EV207_16412 [Scopulibacillus darangshiensis]
MITVNDIRNEIKTLSKLPKFDKMLELSALLTEYFEPRGIKPIIVGGLSVEIYTRGHYTTHDIDLIADGWDQFNDLLSALGFEKETRVWYHKELELAIEIPDNYLEGDMNKIVELLLPSNRKVFVIGVEDLIIHRLESAIVSHPHKPMLNQDYDWAERMFRIHANRVDMAYLLKSAKDVKVDRYINSWIKG